ncbi:MAG: response regulator, partial [Desulfuromonadaceae bacterium]
NERLGIILAKNFGVSDEMIQEVVREQIENVVFSLFTWKKGAYKFEVQTPAEMADSSKMDPLQFILDEGLNPQFLAMEGTGILDGKGHAVEMDPAGGFSSGKSAESAFAPADGSITSDSSPHTVPHPVVIIDDDGPSLRTIAEGLTEKGVVVHALTRSEEALIKVDALHRGGERPAVLIDLIMPKMDGSGVLGGIELLELLHNNFKDLQLIVMTDYHHEDAENKIRDLGYPCIYKPRRVEIGTPAIIGQFLTLIMHVIRHSSDSISAGELQNRFNLGDELRNEMGDDDDMPCAGESVQQSGGLSLLRGMLEELNNPDLQGGALLLVLRFASEFVNRAILFTLNDQVISGFGQFGINGGSISGDERVRAIHFPQGSGSMFDEPLRTGQPCTFSPSFTQLDTYIFEQLGGGTPAEIFIGPLISRSRVIGFLYGDNLPGKKPVGDVEPLVIFLAQAGISMEKTLLERQLNERSTP